MDRGKSCLSGPDTVDSTLEAVAGSPENVFDAGSFEDLDRECFGEDNNKLASKRLPSVGGSMTLLCQKVFPGQGCSHTVVVKGAVAQGS